MRTNPEIGDRMTAIEPRMSLMMISEVGLDETEIQMLRHVYRMVGKRDAGWEFDPAKIPLYIILPLIADYADYLREVDAANDAQVYDAMFFQLLEAN